MQLKLTLSKSLFKPSKQHLRFFPASAVHQSPSRPGEFHPEPLTEPDVSLSTYPARATQ
jgi:hypothetical protein